MCVPLKGVFHRGTSRISNHTIARAKAGLLGDPCKQQRLVGTTNACILCVLTCILILMLGCRAPSADWNGTWKLNSSKSSFQGPVFNISVSSDGEYRWEQGNTGFAFSCDGKFRPMGQERMQACVKNSATAFDLIRKKDGVTTNAFHWELSNGGMIFTSTATAIRPSGSVVTAQIVASRMSGGTDFAGQWRDTSYLQQHTDMILSIVNRVLHVGYPSAGLYFDTPLDGSDIAVHGPRTEDGTTYSARSIGRRDISILTKHYGKVLSQGELVLSHDGRTITESWLNPDKPTDKGTLVYDKQ
jgi:hypothetical protein